MKTKFICPVCGENLTRTEKTYLCENKHSFDVSRQGYVNLLLSSQSSKKHHGDDKLMVAARRDFLEKGYYSFFKDGICAAVSALCPDGGAVLDAGCGEGYYTAAAAQTLAESGKIAFVCGIDISKSAIACAAKRKEINESAVAGVFDIPCRDESFDLVLNIFSPFAFDEYRRVLKKGGFLIRAVPLKDHLMGLKKAIYSSARENVPESEIIPGMELVEKNELTKVLKLDNNRDIMNLFMMTPYYYKTGEEDQQKAQKLESLETELCFCILIYKKSA